jgi:hypothetical protein
MMTQATILRDAAIAGVAIAGLCSLWGIDNGIAAFAGAVGSILNLLLMMMALRGAGVVPQGLVLGRLMLKLVGGAVILVVLLKNFAVVPSLAGFCSVMAGAGFRAFASLGAAQHTPSEAG